MEWALDYYTRQSATFATAAVTDAHREIAARLHGFCTRLERCEAILELGAGNGGTAAALADLGHDVWAIEFNASDAGLARELAEITRRGAMRVVEADFYEVSLPRRFDFVYCWDGFGIGSDADQRRLLRRIAGDWLAEGGRAIIDVFSPWNWLKRDGATSTHTARDGRVWERRIEFDAHGSLFRDHWEPLPERDQHRSQSIRCYSIPEFDLLLEGTGLAADAYVGMDGRELDASAAKYLAQTNGYFALLKAEA